VHPDALLRLELLAAEPNAASRLGDEISRYPRSEQPELYRYAWGLLDDGRDSDRADALWLRAWLAGSR
jgi:hypothetical protein